MNRFRAVWTDWGGAAKTTRKDACGGRAAKAKAALAALLLSVAVGACSRTSGGSSPDTETARLYRRQCAACHGPAGEGGQIGQLKVADLRAPHAVAFTNEQLYGKIHDGGNGMPPFKYSLTEQQMYDLVRFIRNEIQKDGK